MNRILYADDCLNVLNDESMLPTSSVDMIYLDPPFNSNQYYNLPFRKELKKDLKPVQAFKDTWTWDEKEDKLLEDLKNGANTKLICDLIQLTERITKERGGGE